MPDNYFHPEGAPVGAVHNSGELRAYAGIHPRDPVDERTARKLIHGYYACVSFTDAQIGKLLSALDQLNLRDNTIVVLWGDHGWQLGEHQMWNKHSCFETSMHAPLMIVPPADSAIRPGSRVSSLAEFIDIYPTLCEMTGLDVPEHVEGTSLVPVMLDPRLPGKQFAIGRFGAGDTIRTDRFRFSEYRQQGNVSGNMLYDHVMDDAENVNVAPQHAVTVEELAHLLRSNMGKPNPKNNQ